ncbi:MAG: GNAT family N-acetyltransferase [Psychroserpens sp.]|nr:GNAT family N-acetyltransferase [Psychroserpens sp.]
MDFSIRFATENDMPEVLELIKELAVFEREPDAVNIDVADLKTHGFGKDPKFQCFVAEGDNRIVGMALTYERFSTWNGPVLHLEDLIVKEVKRAQGIGTLLLDEVVKYGSKKGFKKITWIVLNWNQPAIDFYKNKGGQIDSEWDSVSLDEKGMQNYLSKL